MSEKVEKVEKTEVTGDADVKQEIERKVVEHIVRFEKDNPNESGTVEKPATGTGTEGRTAEDLQDINSLLKRLDDAEKARLEAEEKLTNMTGKYSTQSDELKQQKSIVQSLALKEFTEKKTVMVEAVRKDLGDERAEEVAEEIKSGEDLDRVKRWLEIFGKTLKPEGTDTTGTPEVVPPKAPTGKVSLRPPATGAEGTELGTVEELVNDIYDNLEEQMFLRAMNQPYDAKKLQHYQTRATLLLKSLIEGERTRGAITPKWSVVECPQCHKILTGGETQCPACGHGILHKITGGR